MAENKTQPTDADVQDFLNGVDNQRRRMDAEVLLDLYAKITGEQAVMWGPSIIGYGQYQYQTADGKSHTFMRSGFSPRKQNMTVYVGAGMAQHPEVLEGLGKHKTSKACLYINKLADVDMAILEKVIRTDLEVMNQKYPQ